MLHIWTGGKPDIVKEALGPAFRRLSHVPDHEVVPVSGEVVSPKKGDVCLVMGTKALNVLQKAKLVHGGRSVGSLRQQPLAGPDGGVYFVTLDPFLVRTDEKAPSQIRQDVALASRYALTGTVDPKLGHYEIVEDLEELVDKVDALLADPDAYVELACDTETRGMHPEGPDARIVTIQFTLEDGHAYVLFVPEDGQLDEYNRACVEYLLTHPRILLAGANWKYDSRWINRHWGILCTNLKRDTLLMGSAVDENRSNSLKTHAWEYTELGGYDRLDELGYDKGRMDLIPPEVLAPYAGADTDVTLQSSRKIKKEMQRSPALVRLYQNVLLPASSSFEAMEHEGVCVDLQAFSELRAELTDELDKQEQAMLDLMPQRLRNKYGDKIRQQQERGASPLTPRLLKDYFFTPYGLNLKPKMVTEKSGEPSTAKAHLMMFEDVPEAKAFIEHLSAHGSAAKTRSTYVDGFLSHLREDGRFHPSYMLFAGSMFGNKNDDGGTATGRTSCKEPAFQTIPSKTIWAKKLRRCFPAPRGHKIIAFDFSQGELKVVACVADESQMIQSFMDGKDLHVVTAAAFTEMSYEAFLKLETADPFQFKFWRTGAKAGNFGLLYGMQHKGFREYARINFGFQMTEAEAMERRAQFFSLYPGLTAYHERMKRMVRKHGMVESPLGRLRHLPLIRSPDQASSAAAERQAINSPIQSALNDLTFMAINECRKHAPHARWFGMVHDQILAYVPDEHAMQTALQCRDIMDNLPIRQLTGWKPQLQFTSDGEIGDRLSTLEKL